MKFCAGNFSRDNVPWLVKQVEVDSNQIETLIENNQHYTTWEIVDILKISKSIKLLVKMKNMSFILQKKLNGLFGQPNTSLWHQFCCSCKIYVTFNVIVFLNYIITYFNQDSAELLFCHNCLSQTCQIFWNIPCYRAFNWSFMAAKKPKVNTANIKDS